MFTLVKLLWRLLLLVHLGLAVIGSLSVLSDPTTWLAAVILWGTFIGHVWLERRVLGRWIHERRVRQAQYWQGVSIEAAARNRR